MNIDIVNSVTASNLNIDIDKVKLINKFYWKKIFNHISDYNHAPLNIDYICVIHPTKYQVKKLILEEINYIRTLRTSPKYKDDSIKRNHYIEDAKNRFRKIWKIRKELNFTN